MKMSWRQHGISLEKRNPTVDLRIEEEDSTILEEEETANTKENATATQ